MLFLLLIDTEEKRSKFEIIYYTYRNLLFYIAMNLLNNDADAEDAVQETFLRVITLLDSISEPSSLKTKHLVVIIVKNISINMLRHRQVHGKCISIDSLNDEYEDWVADTVIESIPEKLDLLNALKSLPDRYAEVLLLRYHEEYSYTDIAKIMGITEPYARKLVQRACDKLRTIMTNT